MERRLGKWELIEVVLRQPVALQLSVKVKEEGSRDQVQLKLGTRHRKESFHNIGRDIAESIGYSTQSVVEVI
jgi:hypothetical protein